MGGWSITTSVRTQPSRALELGGPREREMEGEQPGHEVHYELCSSGQANEGVSHQKCVATDRHTLCLGENI